MFNRADWWGFVNPDQALVVKVWKKSGQQSEAALGVGRQPHLHTLN